MKRIVKGAVVLGLFVSAAAAGAICGHDGAGSADDKQMDAVITITENTRVSAEVRFAMCAHSFCMDKKIFSGMTKDKFCEAFGGRVLEFSSEEVRARKLIYEYCPEHLILKSDEDGQLKVMRPNTEGRLETVQLTGTFLKELGETGKKRAKYGIVLENMGSVRSVIAALKEKE